MAELGESGNSLIGQTLNGRYRVISLIGTGGMSAVYRAEHVQLGMPVALKVLNAEMAAHREAVLRFEREALVSAKIQHPHVVGATDSGHLEDGSLYLVLELVAGRSLRDLINEERKLPFPRALMIAAQIAEALDAAHRTGIVHRDLKPSNVMLLARNGHAEFVKVLDFGLAGLQGTKVEGEALTRAGSIFGTPEYMAPEQARGEEVDGRADLYALGVILYEMLAGRAPFQAAEPVGILIKHIQDVPPPLPREVPVRISSFVMALLEKEPERRPKNARFVSKTLAKLATQAATNSVPPRPLPRALPSSFLAAGALAIAIAAAAGFWSARHHGNSAKAPETAALAPSSHTEQAAASNADPAPTATSTPDKLDKSEKADSHLLLARGSGLVTSGQSARGLDTLANALDEDASLNENPELLRALRRAVDDPSTRDRALDFAARRLGPAAADVLFDVWIATPTKTPATRAARKWLDSPEVRNKARPAALLALEIREAKTCSKVRALLPRMAENGDERSLTSLKRYRTRSGCGFLSLGDCFKCLRQDDALEKAIAAASKREAPSFAAR